MQFLTVDPSLRQKPFARTATMQRLQPFKVVRFALNNQFTVRIQPDKRRDVKLALPQPFRRGVPVTLQAGLNIFRKDHPLRGADAGGKLFLKPFDPFRVAPQLSVDAVDFGGGLPAVEHQTRQAAGKFVECLQNRGSSVPLRPVVVITLRPAQRQIGDDRNGKAGHEADKIVIADPVADHIVRVIRRVPKNVAGQKIVGAHEEIRTDVKQVLRVSGLERQVVVVTLQNNRRVAQAVNKQSAQRLGPLRQSGGQRRRGSAALKPAVELPQTGRRNGAQNTGDLGVSGTTDRPVAGNINTEVAEHPGLFDKQEFVRRKKTRQQAVCRHRPAVCSVAVHDNQCGGVFPVILHKCDSGTIRTEHALDGVIFTVGNVFELGDLPFVAFFAVPQCQDEKLIVVLPDNRNQRIVTQGKQNLINAVAVILPAKQNGVAAVQRHRKQYVAPGFPHAVAIALNNRRSSPG